MKLYFVTVGNLKMIIDDIRESVNFPTCNDGIVMSRFLLLLKDTYRSI